MKRLLFVFFMSIIASGVNAYSIPPEKRIYLLDVTASMVGKGEQSTENIFANVKAQLVTAIKNIKQTNTEILIIPFTYKTFNPIHGYASQKDSLINCINSIKVLKGDTNIADAWEAGENSLDSTKTNYLFLLTDGLHNYGPTKDVLYQRLQNWGNVSKGKYMFAFYVMLTSKAKDNAIFAITNKTDQMWAIQNMNVNVRFMVTPFNTHINIKNTNRFHQSIYSNDVRIMGDKDIKFSMALKPNPYYTLKNVKSHVGEKTYVEYELCEKVARRKIPVDVKLQMYYIYDKKKYPMVFFTPEKFTIQVSNCGTRSIIIKAIDKKNEKK